MKPVTIITGQSGVGKTRKAIEMARGKKSYWLQDLSYHSIREIPEDIELLVIDGISSKKDLAELKSIATQEKLSFRPPYAHVRIEMERPEIIATSQIEFPEEDIRFNVIRL